MDRSDAVMQICISHDICSQRSIRSMLKKDPCPFYQKKGNPNDESYLCGNIDLYPDEVDKILRQEGFKEIEEWNEKEDFEDWLQIIEEEDV